MTSSAKHDWLKTVGALHQTDRPIPPFLRNEPPQLTPQGEVDRQESLVKDLEGYLNPYVRAIQVQKALIRDFTKTQHGLLDKLNAKDDLISAQKDHITVLKENLEDYAASLSRTEDILAQFAAKNETLKAALEEANETITKLTKQVARLKARKAPKGKLLP